MPLFCTNEKIYQERVEAMKAAIIDDEVRDQDRLAECFKRIRAELKEPMGGTEIPVRGRVSPGEGRLF